ncbi:hypothetical protein RBB50_012678 [Rhinocladiella similis]
MCDEPRLATAGENLMTSSCHVIHPTRQAQLSTAFTSPSASNPVDFDTVDTTMPQTELHEFDSLVLKPVKLHHEIRFRKYAGNGRAGHVFKIRMNKEDFALKMFKFDNPALNATKFKGTKRKAFYDPFYIECRANGSLIERGLNGQILPFCYGWTDIPDAIELEVALRFGIQPFLWDRPENVEHQQIRGILYEWVDGRPLTQIKLTSDIAKQARKLLKALHDVEILHGGIAASNFLVEESRQKVHLIDLSASITLPHISISKQELQDRQQKERLALEVGFSLLSENPINQGVCVADFSGFDVESKKNSVADAYFIKHLWAPPNPTRWQRVPP